MQLLNRSLVFLIAAWSGFFVMTIELLGGRLLAPYFGNGIYVWGGVTTIFMLALACGYLIGGRISIRGPSLEKLSIILLGAAGVTIPIMLLGEQTLDRVFTLVHDPRYGSMLSAMLLFFVPTAMSGMVPPYAVRLLVSESRSSGHHAGTLYGISTLGSAAGTLVTSFYLVLYLEINQILWLIIGISTVLVVLTLVLTSLRLQVASSCSRIASHLVRCGEKVPYFPVSFRLVLLRMAKDVQKH